ncbi:hypothetical protein ACT3XG_19335 [Paenibacillus polymyxa]|uniref:hypothetical protein n=1 Tax=Paenibacillus TaxID=44249 RepID=UPI0008B93CCC|nr:MULTISPECIES: hypothetical protein [Paenibacillus]MEB4784787.1 hypothetical protein [Paenibacillus jamilae]KAF6578895.1 hypothetical protein G9G57_23715 [Paenibacillus sp. EKM211P]KAF6617834.1 hypothetical protein HFE00_12155 [Paenibacillus sp. EKM101P]KAF6618643.1 hypothetical protein HFE03_21450 [Paenibacillus sp. EKM102P]KAF6626872.1 hypothetical protein HFE01_21660 [Paenibacillus sp. EKM10P]
MQYRLTDTHLYILENSRVLCFARPTNAYKDLGELMENGTLYHISVPEDFESFDHNKALTPGEGGDFFFEEFLNPVLKLINENKK